MFDNHGYGTMIERKQENHFQKNTNLKIQN